MRYEIDNETYAVSIWDDINPEPFWFQPDYPNGDQFDSYEEAETWAQLALQSHNPNYGFFAPNGKGLAGEAKPTEAQILQSKLSRAGIDINQLKELLEL